MTVSRRTSRSSPTALASTAGALVALVAVAGMITSTAAASSATSAPRGSSEARQTTSEGAKVRAAVAAVAAAARQLIAGERLAHAMPALWVDFVAAVSESTIGRADGRTFSPPIAALPERLLDLPPPARA